MAESIYDYLDVLKKIEIEFESDNKKYTSLKSYIKSMTDDAILIDPPTSKGTTYNIPVGHPVFIIVCVENGGLFIGESKVIGKELSTVSGLWVNYPFNSQLIQRREFLRVPMLVDVEISVYKDVLRTDKKKFNVLTRDISGNGLSYIADEPLKNYYDIECKIFIDGSEPVTAKCEHIHNNLILDENKKQKYIIAFTFVDIEARHVKKIVNACFKYQLDQRKKSII